MYNERRPLSPRKRKNTTKIWLWGAKFLPEKGKENERQLVWRGQRTALNQEIRKRRKTESSEEVKFGQHLTCLQT